MAASDPQAAIDLELIDRVAARDAAALGELYDRHNRLLYSLILRILRDRGDAEEVLQEVFLAVWTRVATYNVELGSPIGWLVRIARNRAIDRLRASAVRLRAVEEAPREEPARNSPEDNAAAGETGRAITAALDTLPREQRILIEDAYFLGLTHSELADKHGLPLGTVKTRIRTGMQALRQALTPVDAQR